MLDCRRRWARVATVYLPTTIDGNDALAAGYDAREPRSEDFSGLCGLKIFLAFIAGLIVGQAIPIVWYIVATTYFGVFDRDGGGAMGAIFIMGPLMALVVGTAAAIFTAWRTA